jgi:RimJ/RimL family protein N-acetyltransferase
MTGSVVAIYVTAAGGAPMQGVPRAELERGRGIRGDRYYAGAGTFSKKAETRADQEVTLIESEEIDAFGRSTGLELEYGAPRRNIVTRGVRLNDLVGARFAVGSALLEGMRLCEPCAHMAALVSQKVLPGLVHRAGLRARILIGGVVEPGDSVAPTSDPDARAKDLQTEHLTLVLQTPEEVRARIAMLAPAARAEVSADWLEQLDTAIVADPWVHGFAIVRRDNGAVVGYCGFKGVPRDGVVEIAYGVNPDQQRKGFATEAAAALVEFAFRSREIELVRAHTLPDSTASQRVLAKSGFERAGDAIDPDDGLVWRFEQRRT